QNPVNPTVRTSEDSGSRSAAVIGWILVGLGIFFLMDEFLYPWFQDLFYWFNIRRIWPAIFIIVGVLIISSANKKSGPGPLREDRPPAPGGPGPMPGNGPSSVPPVADRDTRRADEGGSQSRPGTPGYPAGPENPDKF
ncbi:MAG TPA: hypothetical protein VD772_00545, partial [Anseongella sp.]|nr:hypothetical protein [Anseongella sp.]